MKKIENYLNKFQHYTKDKINKLKYPVKILKTLYEQFRSKNLLDSDEIVVLTPYDAVSDWLLDVVIDGFLLTTVYTYFIGWKSLIDFVLRIFVLGIMMYLTLNFISNVSKAIKR